MSEKKDETFRSKLNKYLKEYTDTTTIHGLHYLLGDRSKFEKIFWAIVLLSSLLICLLMIYTILMKFERDPIVVSFSKKYTPIYNIPFPAFTVCPESKCDKAKFNYTATISEAITKVYSGEKLSLVGEKLENLLYMNQLCRQIVIDHIYNGSETFSEKFYEVIEKNAPSSPFTQCLFLQDEYINCTNFLTPVITDVGVCYSFNILDRQELYRDHVVHYKNYHRVSNSSRDFDSELFTYSKYADIFTYPRRALFSGFDNSFRTLFKSRKSTTDYLCSELYDGFRILVHSPVNIPRLSKYFLRIPLGRVVTLAVQPELIVTSESVKHLESEKRQCYWQHERYLRHFKIYTQSNCMLECLTNYTLKKCGCVDFYMPREKNTAICGTKKAHCLKRADNELQLEDIKIKMSGENSQTYCDCKPSCTELRYDTELSHGQLSWKKINVIFGLPENNNITEDVDLSHLSIFLKEDHFLGIERNELFGISDLISNFGGLLGLFTGFSLISFCEIFYCLTIKIFCNSKMYGSWSGPKN